MERDLMSRLMAWKDSPRRKPLMLNGARQVGKTWLLRKFGAQGFANVAYVNFDGNPQMAAQFEQDYDTDRLIMAIQTATRQRVSPHDTLIILDEIQECPKALTSLKYFCENARQYAIAAAGSLLGITIHEGTGYPVGKVNEVGLYPLTFGEFLDAMGEEMLRELLKSGDKATIQGFSEKLTSLLRLYYFVGGMPEAVDVFAQTRDLAEARAVHEDILHGYERDISKHLTPQEAEYTIAAWNSIPAHLGRENKKFVFGHIREGARARDYRAAITWLTEAGIATRVPRVSKPGVPLSAYVDGDAFKLFGVDVGLLGAMSGLDQSSVIDGNAIYTEFKGALTEQYVCQELVAQGMSSFYWSADNSRGEIDFLVQRGRDVYPIEVKAEENVRAKSLRAFSTRYQDMKCRRFSLSGFRDEGWLTNTPLYAIGETALWK